MPLLPPEGLPRLGPSVEWPLAGVFASLLLHAVAGWGALPGHAQTNGTVTESTTTATGFESPPACGVIGSTREVQTLTSAIAVGPACIGIGNRDVPNPSPNCPTQPPPGFPPGLPDPGFGTTVLVPFGSTNQNFNLHTLTLTCVAPTPALPWPWLGALAAGLLATGASLRHRVVSREPRPDRPGATSDSGR